MDPMSSGESTGLSRPAPPTAARRDRLDSGFSPIPSDGPHVQRGSTGLSRPAPTSGWPDGGRLDSGFSPIPSDGPHAQRDDRPEDADRVGDSHDREMRPQFDPPSQMPKLVFRT